MMYILLIVFWYFSYFHISRETYNALTNWLTDARMLASQNIVIILCGNKKDLDADREVTFLEASRFAQENGASSWLEIYKYNCTLKLTEITCFKHYCLPKINWKQCYLDKTEIFNGILLFSYHCFKCLLTIIT